MPRSDNANGARAKTIDPATVPVSAGLVRLYSAYMFDEYGELDSDYVFVNLFAESHGAPLRYDAVPQVGGPAPGPHRHRASTCTCSATATPPTFCAMAWR